MQKEREFTGLRAHFWPIKMTDMKKVIPLFIIFTCLSSASTFITDFKDFMFAGYFEPADCMALLKFGNWQILLGGIPLYLIGIHYLSPKKFFLTVLNVYSIGFAISAFLLIFAPDILKSNAAITLFLPYSFNFVTTVLCWILLTQIFSIHDCKRVFAVFFICLTITLLPIPILESYIFVKSRSLSSLLFISIGLCMIAKYSYYYLHKHILSFDETQEQDTPIATTISFVNSLKQSLTSPTLYLMLFMMVLFYTCSHLFDTLMKYYLKEFINTTGEVNNMAQAMYHSSIGHVFSIKGIAEIVFLLFAGIGLLYKKSWGFVAKLIPVTIVVASITMLILISCPDVSKYLSAILQKKQADILFYGSAFCAVLIGMFSTMFLILKSMIYFYLGTSEQTKGRIIFEFIGTMMLGKTLGHLITARLMVSKNTANMSEIALPILGITLILGIIMFWVVHVIGKRIQAAELA